MIVIAPFVAYVVTCLVIGVGCAFLADDWSYRPFAYAFGATALLVAAIAVCVWAVYTVVARMR